MKEKISRFSKKILQHELIRGSSYLFLGTFFANILAFLFNLFVIRKLSYTEYGEYASLISLFTLIAVPSSAFTTVIVRFATDFFSKKEIPKAKKLYVQMTLIALIFSLSVLLGFIIFGGMLKEFLHLNDTVLIIWVGAMIVVSYITIVNTSFLQSLLRFDFVAITTLASTLLKLLIGVIMVLLGLGLRGIFSGIFFSMLIAYGISFFPLRFFKKISHSGATVPVKNILLYSLPASISVFAMSSFISTDVILVKHFFSPQLAGIYSGLSLIGRVIFYFTGTIPMVMFPLLIKRYNEKKNVTSLLFLSMVLVLVPSVAITGFYLLFPAFSITIFLGGKGYLQARGYLGFFGLFITLYSLINLLTNFFLSLKKMFVVWILLIGSLMQIFLIVLFHRTFMQVILDSLVTLLVILIALLLYYVQAYAAKTRQFPDLPNNPSL